MDHVAMDGMDDVAMDLPLPPIAFSYAIKSAGPRSWDSDVPGDHTPLAAVNPMFDDDMDDLQDMMLPLPPQHNLACYPYNILPDLKLLPAIPLLKSCQSLPRQQVCVPMDTEALCSSLSEAMQTPCCQKDDAARAAQPRPKVTLVRAAFAVAQHGTPGSDPSSVPQPATPEPKTSAVFDGHRKHMQILAAGSDTAGSSDGADTGPSSCMSVHSSFSTLTCPGAASCQADSLLLADEDPANETPVHCLEPQLYSLECRVEPGQRMLYLGSLRMMDTTHVKFPVITITNLPDWSTTQTKVWRRFSDFLALHDALTVSLPGICLPVKPNKFRPTGPRFLDARQAELQRYLNRLAVNPVIRATHSLQAFLQQVEFDPSSCGAGSNKLCRTPSVVRGTARCVASRQQLRQRLVQMEAAAGAELSCLEKKLRAGTQQQVQVQADLETFTAAAHSVVAHMKDAAQEAARLAGAFKDLAALEVGNKVLPSKCRAGRAEEAVALALETVAELEVGAGDQLTQHFEALDEELHTLDIAQEALSGRESMLMKCMQLCSQLSSNEEALPRSWSFHLPRATSTMETQLSSMLADYHLVAQQQAHIFEPLMAGLRGSLMAVARDFAQAQEHSCLELNLAWTEAAARLW